MVAPSAHRFAFANTRSMRAGPGGPARRRPPSGRASTSLRPRVAGPAVAHHGAADGDRGGDEGAERDRRVVVDHREPDPARPLAFDLDRAGDEELAVVRPAGADRLAPGAKGERGLVHLDQAGEGLALGVDHRPAQLARPAARPTCSCPARAASTAAGPRCRSRGWPSARRPGTRCAGRGGCRAAPSRRSPRPGARRPRTAAVSRSRPSSQPLSWPQAGQRNPSGQRFSSSQRAQAASSGNLSLELRQRSRQLGHLVPLLRP